MPPVTGPGAPPAPAAVDTVLIGAGQAGLSAAAHLQRRGLDAADDLVVLDANPAPGGAWQHRWDGLTTETVHGIFGLPGMSVPDPVPESAGPEPVNTLVPRYFAAYEERFALPVRRPVTVRAVRSRPDGRLSVESDAGRWTARALVNATGTWDRPFVPTYPGAAEFRGRQLHTADYAGPEELAGQRVLVVGGGHSAVQHLAEISAVAETIWVTRRPPRWRSRDFDRDEARAAVARVEEQVRAGLPPQSVVTVTGLHLREQEQQAAARGAYHRWPMIERIVPDGVVWADGTFRAIDVILWATGFRAALDHLAPLRLREPGGGIRMDGTRVVSDPRVHLLGYGPSASTVGGNRAGLAAARALTPGDAPDRAA